MERITALFTMDFTIWHGMLLGLVSGIVIMLSFALFGPGAAMRIIIPFQLVFAIVIMYIMTMRWRKLMPKITRILIEEGICAGCAYTLEDLEETDDGMLVCPECAAAWRSDRVLRFASIAKTSGTRTLRGEFRNITRQMGSGIQRRGIRDDRDSPRVVIAMHAARKLRPVGDHRDRLRKAIKKLRPMGRANRIALTGFFVLISVYFFWDVASDVLYGVPPGVDVFIPIFMGLLELLLAFSIIRGDMGRSSEAVWREFIKRELCPSCAADLKGKSPEDDACITCPDCRATWRMHDAKSPPTPPPSP